MSPFEITLLLVTIHLLLGLITFIGGVILKQMDFTWFTLLFTMLGGVAVFYCILVNLLHNATQEKKDGTTRWYHKDLRD